MNVKRKGGNLRGGSGGRLLRARGANCDILTQGEHSLWKEIPPSARNRLTEVHRLFSPIDRIQH